MKIAVMAALALAGAALAGIVAQAGGSKPATVRVTEREFKLTLSNANPPTGQTRFEIRNTGKLAHELAIAGKSVNARTKMIKPGKSAVLVVDLEQGRYSVWCPIPGHAAKGMKASITVDGPSQPGGGGGAGDATTAPGDTGTGPSIPGG
jgi:plastocyanin